MTLGNHNSNLYSSKHGLPLKPKQSKPKSIHFGTHFGSQKKTPYKYDPTVAFTEIGGPSTPATYELSVTPNYIPETNRYNGYETGPETDRYNGYGGSLYYSTVKPPYKTSITESYKVPKHHYNTTPIPVYMLKPQYTATGATVRSPVPVYEPTNPPYIAPVYRPTTPAPSYETSSQYVPKFHSNLGM